MTNRKFIPKSSVICLALALAALALFGVLAPSQSTVQAQEAKLGETSVVVPAGGEATIDFETFCLEFGKEFPSTLGTPDGRASDDVLRVLKTAVQEGMVDSQPLQTQLAIWRLVEGEFPYSADEIDPSMAAALIERSADADISPIEGEGVALDQAVAEGLIEAVSENFDFIPTDTVLPDEEPYKGSGTLLLRNTTGADITVFFSLGIVFRADGETQQDIVAYAVEEEEQSTPTPTETMVPTETPDATPTATPTPHDRIPETGADLSDAMFGGGTDGGDDDGNGDNGDDDNGNHDDNDSDGDDRMPDTGADLSDAMLGGGTDGGGDDGNGDHDDDNGDDDNGNHDDDNDSDGDDRMPDTGADLSNAMLGGGTDGGGDDDGNGDHNDDNGDDDNGNHDDNDSDGDDRMPDTGADLSDTMLGGGTDGGDDGNGDHDDDNGDDDNGNHDDNDSDGDDRMPDTGADLSDTMLGGGTDGGDDDGNGDHDDDNGDDDNGNHDDDNDSDGDDRMPDTGADLSADVANASAASAAVSSGIVPNHLVIPSIDVETSVESVGYTPSVDAFGVRYKAWQVAEYAAGWHSNTALPDDSGNVVISGHNNILGSIFRELYKMQVGEQILLYQNGQPFVYEVDEVMLLSERGQSPDVMAENARWIGDFDDNRLTLVSCWPEWSNTHRVVVVALPVE